MKGMVISMTQEFLTPSDKRTKYCGEFSSSDIGKTVCVMGWVQRQRDLGSLIFIDLRDRSGIIHLWKSMCASIRIRRHGKRNCTCARRGRCKQKSTDRRNWNRSKRTQASFRGRNSTFRNHWKQPRKAWAAPSLPLSWHETAGFEQQDHSAKQNCKNYPWLLLW